MKEAIDLKSADTLAHRIRELLESHNISASTLSKLTGIPQPTIHRLVSQATPDPRISTVYAIAKFFNVTLDYLINDSASINDDSQINATRNIPVFTLNNAHEFNTNHASKHILVSDCPHQRCFAIESTASMTQKIPLGTLLIVDPEKKALDGDLIAVRYLIENTNTIREFSKDGPHTLLIPLSPSLPYENLDIHKSIFGVVIQFVKHL